MIKNLVNFALDLFKMLGLLAYTVVAIMMTVAFIFAVFGLLGAVVGTFFWAILKVALCFNWIVLWNLMFRLRCCGCLL